MPPDALQPLIDAAFDPILVMDEGGRVRAVNDVAARMFGCAPAKLIGKDVSTLLEEANTRRAAGDVTPLPTRRLALEPGAREVLGRRANGDAFPASVSVAAAPTGGEPLLVAFVRDLAAPRAARSLESRLSEAGRFSLLAEMAAGIAHEINQPLSAIATYAQAARRILEREKPSARTLAEICTKIEDQALRAGGVLENLRKFMRRQEIRKEVLDVNRLVGDVLGVIEAEALVAGIAVTARLAETVPPVRANALQLQQVLLDVARNAIDAMRQEPQHDLGISIATSATDGGGASIAVTDHGPGVSRQLGDNIFHPFVTTKRDALGVGLAVGRTIVQCYGGSLTYHDNPAGGAVFVIELPPVEGAENGSAQPDGNDEQRRPAGLSR